MFRNYCLTISTTAINHYLPSSLSELAFFSLPPFRRSSAFLRGLAFISPAPVTTLHSLFMDSLLVPPFVTQTCKGGKEGRKEGRKEGILKRLDKTCIRISQQNEISLAHHLTSIYALLYWWEEWSKVIVKEMKEAIHWLWEKTYVWTSNNQSLFRPR